METYVIKSVFVLCSLSRVTPASISVLLGDEVLLPCILTPDKAEQSKVRWIFNKTTVISEGRNVTSERDRFSLYMPYAGDWYLKIARTESGDKGTYTCASDDVTWSTTDLIIDSAPVIHGYPSRSLQLYVCQTATLTLWCNVTGLPVPSLKWYFRSPNRTETSYIQLTKRFITIRDVRPYNAGTYRCDVTNIHGNAYQELTLTVIELVTMETDPRGYSKDLPKNDISAANSGPARNVSNFLCLFCLVYVSMYLMYISA